MFNVCVFFHWKDLKFIFNLYNLSGAEQRAQIEDFTRSRTKCNDNKREHLKVSSLRFKEHTYNQSHEDDNQQAIVNWNNKISASKWWFDGRHMENASHEKEENSKAKVYKQNKSYNYLSSI